MVRYSDKCTRLTYCSSPLRLRIPENLGLYGSNIAENIILSQTDKIFLGVTHVWGWVILFGGLFSTVEGLFPQRLLALAPGSENGSSSKKSCFTDCQQLSFE